MGLEQAGVLAQTSRVISDVKVDNPLPSRRQVLRRGAKLAYVAPAVMTLSAQQAFAGASNPSGTCSAALITGELCETDSDCCSRDCDFGICK